MPQGARDGGVAMTGCTVCRKEPGMAVWLCQDVRQIFAPAISAFPPSMVVVCHKEPGMAVWLTMIVDRQGKFAYRFPPHFFLFIKKSVR